MDRYHRLNKNRWIDGHRSDQDFVINDRYSSGGQNDCQLAAKEEGQIFNRSEKQ
jgi:hypothetical protein